MLYSLGDSHCDFTFKNIPNVSINRLGPLTMSRVGYLEDNVLPNAVQNLNLSLNDTLILSFGEIDVRCWASIHFNRKQNFSFLQNWVDRYLYRASTLNTKAKIAILSVPPPAPQSYIHQSHEFPVNGSDQERSLYTEVVNNFLKLGCQKCNFIFLDVYSLYKDEYGMLPQNQADEQHIHIKNNNLVHKLLLDLNLVT